MSADLATARRKAEEALRNVEREKLVSHIREAAKFATRSERMVFLHDYEAKALVAVIDALRSLLAASPEPAPAMPEEVAHGEKLPAVVDRFGECLMCGRTYRAGLPAKVAAAARAYTKAVWDHEHCECPNGECIHMVAKRVAAYEVANAAVAAKDGTDV